MNVELSRKVEDSPHDVDAWLALIEHQDKLLGVSEDGRRKTTNAERRSTADIKIHMFEKALRNTTELSLSEAGQKLRERLWVGLMKEGAKIWDIKTLSDKWEAISADHLNSFSLGRRYLDFQQSTFTTFRYEAVRDMYLTRIELQIKAITEEQSQEQRLRILENVVYTLLRATLFIRQSGFCELAVAIWQGLLELNFFPPQSLGPSLPTSEVFQAFQDFWDSEVLRIGEHGATGWHTYAANPESAKAPNQETDPGSSLIDNDSLFEDWCKAEISRTNASRLPARTLDEVVEDDPYRVILFHDIEPFLISFSMIEGLRSNINHLLLEAFLLFCQLPPLAQEGFQRQWHLDPFIGGDALERDQKSIHQQLGLNLDLSDNMLQPPCNSFAICPDICFGGFGDFKLFSAWQESYPHDSGPLSYGFVKNSLQMLAASPHIDEEFLEYFLAFVFINEPQNAKKIAKNLLKQRPTSLRLYNAYGLLENYRGNTDLANNVFVSAIGMQKGSADELQTDRIQLWRSLVWTSLDRKDLALALRYLLIIPEGIIDSGSLSEAHPSPTTLLKTRQHLSSMRDYLLSLDRSRAAIYAELYILLEYLASPAVTTHQGDINTALTSVSSFIETLSARGHATSYAAELLHQFTARLLHHHSKTGYALFTICA
jgi:hypothetical protein